MDPMHTPTAFRLQTVCHHPKWNALPILGIREKKISSQPGRQLVATSYKKRTCRPVHRGGVDREGISADFLPDKEDTTTPRSNAAESVSSHKPKLWEQGWRLTKRTAQVVFSNAWALILLFLLCDGATFLLHRVSHRLTNAAAMQFLGRGITSEALGSSLWFLSNNPEVANFQTGYQWLVGIVFIMTFPLAVLLRTVATSTAAVICASTSGKLQNPGWIPPLHQVLQQLRDAVGQVVPVSTRIWQVDLLVAVRTIPLQGLSLLLLPLYWTLPLLLNLQLAQPLALFEGEHGDDAIVRSAQVVRPVRSLLAVPYVGLLLASKLLAFIGRVLLTSISPRIAREVPEIPILAYIAVAVASAILGRVQDMLPVVTYISIKDKEAPGSRLSVVK